MLFINMAVIPFMLATVTIKYFNPGGLLDEIENLLILSIILPPILGIIVAPGWWIRKFKIWRLNQFLKDFSGSVYHQNEANETVRRLPFPITSPYSFILSQTAFILFFYKIYPFGLVLGILSIIVSYWMWKVSV